MPEFTSPFKRIYQRLAAKRHPASTLISINPSREQELQTFEIPLRDGPDDSTPVQLPSVAVSYEDYDESDSEQSGHDIDERDESDYEQSDYDSDGEQQAEFPSLPPELIYYIAQLIAQDVNFNQYILLQACLVCSDWYALCAPRLFRTILLSDPKQFEAMLLCLASPYSSITRYARALYVEQYARHPPWAHTVPMRLAQRLNRLETIIFVGIDEWSVDDGDNLETSARSEGAILIYTDCFRTPPSIVKAIPSMFAPFKSLARLRLDHWNLQSFFDIIHLVHKCPSLRRLELYEMETGVVPQKLPSWHFSTCHLQTIETSSCRGDKHLPLLWLWAAPVTGRGPSRSVSNHESPTFPGMWPHEAQILKDITSATILRPGSGSWDQEVQCRHINEGSWELTLKVSWAEDGPALPGQELTIHLDTAQRVSGNGQPVPASIRRITLGAPHGLLLHDREAQQYIDEVYWDYTRLDTLLSQLLSLKGIDVDDSFAWKYRSISVAAVLETLKQILPTTGSMVGRLADNHPTYSGRDSPRGSVLQDESAKSIHSASRLPFWI